MAEQLELLVHHYHNINSALQDFENGEEFGDEDIKGKATSFDHQAIC